MARDEYLQRIRSIADRVAGSFDLDIFDVQLRRESIGWVLRVVVDRKDPGRPETPEESVGIDDCRRVSVDLGAILDVDEELNEAALGHPYTLEVSSPGLDRPLRHAAEYRRFAGRLAKIVVSEPVAGQTHFAGRIQGLEDGIVVLQEGRRTHRIPLAAISRGRLDVEF